MGITSNKNIKVYKASDNKIINKEKYKNIKITNLIEEVKSKNIQKKYFHFQKKI